MPYRGGRRSWRWPREGSPIETWRPVVESHDAGGSTKVALTVGDLALPRRVSWLGTRRPPRWLDESAIRPLTWLLAATDGPSYAIRDARVVTAEVAGFDTAAQHRIRGTSRELMAVLLGRSVSHAFQADESAVSSLLHTFPGP